MYIPNLYENIQLLENFFLQIKHVAFSSDGESFATCGQDATICVWQSEGDCM